MTDVWSAARAGHETHDLELVARAAAGDLEAREAPVARERLAGCDACAAVAADLAAIAVATRELRPAAVVAGGPGLRAPRDFRLSPADAVRLRRRSILALGWASPIAGRARDLGGALATLGLVGLLVATGLPGLGGGAASSTALEEIGASLQSDDATAAPALGPVASDTPAPASSGDPTRTEDRAGDQGRSPVTAATVLAAGSAAVLLLGLTLLFAGGRRRRSGP